MQRLLPLLPQLVVDTQSIIRQHLASQLLPLCLTCMFGDGTNFDPNDETTSSTQPHSRIYNEEGYKIVTSTLLNHMNTLITDPDVDVRKAASDALATLALYIKPNDIASMILPIPLRLIHEHSRKNPNGKGGASSNNNVSLIHNNNNNNIANNNTTNNNSKKNDDQGNDDFHITATNLLGDIASLDSNQVPPSLVSNYITPAILSLCNHSSFRVRRAAVQSLPRVIHGSSIADVELNLLPCFVRLGMDDMYRVRKSVGECLVDMSRSLMLLPSTPNHTLDMEMDMDAAAANNGMGSSSTMGKSTCEPMNMMTLHKKYSKMNKEELMAVVMEMRRKTLVPICTQLLNDGNKFVRNGMMQFLGPFIASFYPLQGQLHKKEEEDKNGIVQMLAGRDKENQVGGMGVQFFPHANGMVSRLNPSSISAAAVKKDALNGKNGYSKNSNKDTEMENSEDSTEYLESLLPTFLEKCHNDSKSLALILHHKENHPINPKDEKIVIEQLLPPYVELANINSGDDNVDAEMRVYCAYSLPAVVLLLGKDGWQSSLKRCFLSLITGHDGSTKVEDPISVPLPVKRCLASSFHTICHVLGSQALKGTTEEKNAKRDLLSVFENNFLRDADDTVRLNIIRNLPSFLSLLSFSKRSKYLPSLYEIITGDAMLAAKRKNALNPMILNWRQRDMIAQVLPNLIILYKPSQVRQYIWPIVKILMSDSVNLVRENVEWSIPIILRCYETKKCKYDNDDVAEASKFSAEACNEVYVFLKATLLDNNPYPSQQPGFVKVKSSGSFSKRQSYCRVLTAVALILRLNDKEKRRQRKKKQRQNIDVPPHPFYNLSSDEYRHVYHILQELLLPSAIVMKDDKVTNVRLALAKCLRVMPPVIRDEGDVSIILSTLEEEIQTWEGGGGQYIDGSGPNPPSSPSKKHHRNGSNKASPTRDSQHFGDDTQATQAAIERGKQQAEEDEKRLKQKGSEGDESASLASI